MTRNFTLVSILVFLMGCEEAGLVALAVPLAPVILVAAPISIVSESVEKNRTPSTQPRVSVVDAKVRRIAGPKDPETIFKTGQKTIVCSGEFPSDWALGFANLGGDGALTSVRADCGDGLSGTVDLGLSPFLATVFVAVRSVPTTAEFNENERYPLAIRCSTAHNARSSPFGRNGEKMDPVVIKCKDKRAASDASPVTQAAMASKKVGSNTTRMTIWFN